MNFSPLEEYPFLAVVFLTPLHEGKRGTYLHAPQLRPDAAAMASRAVPPVLVMWTNSKHESNVSFRGQAFNEEPAFFFSFECIPDTNVLAVKYSGDKVVRESLAD